MPTYGARNAAGTNKKASAHVFAAMAKICRRPNPASLRSSSVRCVLRAHPRVTEGHPSAPPNGALSARRTTYRDQVQRVGGLDPASQLHAPPRSTTPIRLSTRIIRPGVVESQVGNQSRGIFWLRPRCETIALAQRKVDAHVAYAPVTRFRPPDGAARCEPGRHAGRPSLRRAASSRSSRPHRRRPASARADRA